MLSFIFVSRPGPGPGIFFIFVVATFDLIIDFVVEVDGRIDFLFFTATHNLKREQLNIKLIKF